MLVTCAIVIQDQRVLVTQRPPHKSRGGRWEFPGGKVNEDESPEDCVIRELMEELDISITVLQQLSTARYEYPDLSIELMPFQCHIRDGSIRLHEHTAYRWATIHELKVLDLCGADRMLLPQIETLL